MVREPHETQDLSFEYPDSEIVIGLGCPVGTDYSKVSQHLIRSLSSYGYRANILVVSSFITETAEALGLGIPLPSHPEAARLEAYMDAGNGIRRETGRCDVFALVAASRLASSRSGADAGNPEPFPRVVHLILTLKRPEEVETLRRIYGPGFFLVGVTASEQQRLEFLMNEKSVARDDAVRLIKRDLEDEDREFGQRTRDTFHLSDVFVAANGLGHRKDLDRFLQLIFGFPYSAPTPDELGMYHAFSASLRSVQLGRQVGASLVNRDHDLIAVGCNEVPAAGGGLYWEGNRPDFRDHVRREDSNDRRKAEIIADIVSRLRASGLLLPVSETAPSAELVLRKSMLWDITEFGRAVHAEMDALLSCSRTGMSPVGATLYTTTFPCHNCTRHIVAAGIRRVVYIEPYPKSQAAPLHDDSIRVEGAIETRRRPRRNDTRIPFEPFIGIGPRIFDLFSIMLSKGYQIERKTRQGRTLDWKPRSNAKPRVPMAPTSYLQREMRAAKEVYSLIDAKRE
ncbi:MAG: hypothetical protein JNL98_22880 [Bryobacterales bacterium]|nr:hypothetical protein [Bryobacterales bacterium]